MLARGWVPVMYHAARHWDRHSSRVARAGSTRAARRGQECTGRLQTSTDDRGRMRTRRQIVGCREEPSALGADTEHIEEVARDDRAAQQIRFTIRIETGRDPAPRGKSVEQPIAVAKCCVSWIREDASDRAPECVDEPIAIVDREVLQQRRVDETEDRGVRADAKRERKNGGDGKAATLPQRS